LREDPAFRVDAEIGVFETVEAAAGMGRFVAGGGVRCDEEPCQRRLRRYQQREGQDMPFPY